MIDGIAFTHGKIPDRTTAVYTTRLPIEKALPVYEKLRDSLCNQNVRNLWGQLIGISSIAHEGLIEIRLFALASNLMNNPTGYKIIEDVFQGKPEDLFEYSTEIGMLVSIGFFENVSFMMCM